MKKKNALRNVVLLAMALCLLLCMAPAAMASEVVKMPEAVVTDIKNSYGGNPPLTFALNYSIKDYDKILEDEEYLEALMAAYGDWYTDYVLTISGLSEESVTFNANGKEDGYLAGRYKSYTDLWISVPFKDVTVQNGKSLYIMEYAADLMGQPGLRYRLKEVAEIVVSFDCGIYFTPEFLAANPNIKISLDLKVF